MKVLKKVLKKLKKKHPEIMYTPIIKYTLFFMWSKSEKQARHTTMRKTRKQQGGWFRSRQSFPSKRSLSLRQSPRSPRPPQSRYIQTPQSPRSPRPPRSQYIKPQQTYNNQFNSEPCDDSMTFQDCELAVLRQAVDANEDKKKQSIANSEEVKKMIEIVEDFLKDTKCICYGGTAINNILPTEAQFYNRDTEIPDYDFYSPKPLDHAKQLADIFFNAGYSDVEAKAGVHAGTFKVFVNFIPMADITELHPILFDNISKDAIEMDGLLYCPANFLRMNMFIELSRPDGDVSRWEKVLKRLTLLNQHYPLIAENCDTVTFQRTIEKSKTDSERIYEIARDSFIDQGCVFFGGYASSMYARYMSTAQKRVARSIPDFDVLAEDVELTCNIVKEQLQGHGMKQITIVDHEEIGETIPYHKEIRVGKDTIAFVYQPVACHSYNEIEIQRKPIRIATIDTMLTFYLAFLYTNNSELEGYNQRILCMSQFLFDVEQSNRLSQKGLLKRFSMTCYGTQSTLESMRAEKSRQFELLKKNRDSFEFQRLFLRYHPTNKSVNRHTRSKKKIDKEKSKTPKSKTPKKRETKEKSKTPEGFVFKFPLRKNWLF